MTTLSLNSQFKEGRFENVSFTPAMAEGANIYKVLKQMLTRPKTVRPSTPVPFVKTNLQATVAPQPVVTWFGHSSYLIQHAGKNILVDPVFSGYASPVPGMIKAFTGSNHYQVSDMPEIDLLIITHNHYDHLDAKTIQQILPKVTKVVTGLHVGKDIAKNEHREKITELDWWQSLTVEKGISVTAAPARHFSGRGLKRNTSLWSSFVLELGDFRIYIGGDSGYDTHFRIIGKEFNGFDYALLECGQYNEAWPFIHMMPEQTLQAAIDLDTRILQPVHWAKFTLANHPWTEPIERITRKAEKEGFALNIPKIGEPVIITTNHINSRWWEG